MRQGWRLPVALVLAAALAPWGADSLRADEGAATVPPTMYVADFVSTAATGIDVNDRSEAVGTSYPDPGCGSTCLPPLETVAWRRRARVVLSSVPGLSGIAVRAINARGWVAGFAGYPDINTHGVVWKPVGDSYQAIDLGLLPGTTMSVAIGIDDSNRVVGYSTTASFPPNGSPFMWTEAGGMVNLEAAGYPDVPPSSISPGGTVSAPPFWYRLGDLGSVTQLPPPPQGFRSPFAGTINDSGDQGMFLVSTSGQALSYLFRFNHTGSWQQISFTPNGHLLPWGLGSITSAGTITATDGGAGKVAYGPDGMAEPLTPLLSPAYQGAEATVGGPISENGQILAQVMIGRSPRLMRLTPAAACATNCIRITSLRMSGRFIPDPKDPDHCTPDASNHVVAKLVVTDEAGAGLQDVRIISHFLDDYWLDHVVTGRTDSRGAVRLVHDGPACVGAVAFLVGGASKPGRVFDRTRGVLTKYVIPVP